MILIADSGSTKCDWLMLDGDKIAVECHTMGFNPYFHDEATIAGKVGEKSELMQHAAAVEAIYFYGAGSSSPELKAVVSRALAQLFPFANIHIGHDLDGAALATYEGQPHIACILGTGSNSCYFDGELIHEEVPALAYILGDEGSGSYIGKRLLADFFYKRMPAQLAEEFQRTYDMNMKTMVEHVYTQPHANVYLASLSKFCAGHKTEPYVQAIVREGLDKFLQIHVCCFPNHKSVNVNFVGSIAYYYEDILRAAAAPLGIRVGKVVKQPIKGLMDYHLKYTLSKVG